MNDLALLRPERTLPGVAIELLGAEPLVVVMPADHRLAARTTIRSRELVDERLIGVPAATSPVLRALTDAYARASGIELVPDYEVDNLSVAMSLVVSTGGIALMALRAQSAYADGRHAPP